MPACQLSGLTNPQTRLKLAPPELLCLLQEAEERKVMGVGVREDPREQKGFWGFQERRKQSRMPGQGKVILKLPGACREHLIPCDNDNEGPLAGLLGSAHLVGDPVEAELRAGVLWRRGGHILGSLDGTRNKLLSLSSGIGTPS